MPQIRVNEIDRSVVTRVVSDNKVKVLCPIISSFGPGYDGTQSSVQTFTDVTDFNRAYGYTYAQFNPFKNDRSRMYARELIKKGAAVSVVRLNNNGSTASFELDGPEKDRADITKIGLETVCPAAWNNAELLQYTVQKTSDDTTTHANTIPGTVKGTATVTISSAATPVGIFDDGNKTVNYAYNGTVTKFGTIDYTTGVITPTATGGSVTSIQYSYFNPVDSDGNPVTIDWYKYTFCPQIAGIEAKYPGSFGNNIMISISQVNTSRLTESYQYAVISVYFIDRQVNYAWDATSGTSYISSQVVKGTTLLENKRISTNPNSPDYFEDVEFDFIRIIPTANARDELALVWNNIENGPDSSRTYSGFPVIPFKYKDAQGYTTNYNFAALFTKTFGTDFQYDSDVVELLKNGYVDYWNVAGASGWTVAMIDKYMKNVYGDTSTTPATAGIIQSIYTTLADTYENFADPYIYDFDFITSSGFIYDEWKLVEPKKNGEVVDEPVSITPGTALTGSPLLKPGTVTIIDSTSGTAKQFKDNGVGGLYLSTDTTKAVVGKINYEGGIITAPTGGQSPFTATYTTLIRDDAKPLVAEMTYPISSGTGWYAQYTSVTPIHQSMKNLVETRQDCIALFDLPRDYDKKLCVEYARLLNTSYGTIHNPWCYINSPDVYGKQIPMVPSYIFLYTFLANLIDNVDSQKWFPPAGVDRATARVVTKPDYEIGSVILDEWQNNNTSRVNPIMKLKQYGYVIYGQYTTLQAIDLYTHSALESLNVRLISNVVKKKIFDVCLNLAFDPNNQKLWLKFFAQMDEFLRYMKYNDGLYDYKIVMDESTVTTDDINHLRCPGKVLIAPTRTAEFFDIDFIITDAGVTFTD